MPTCPNILANGTCTNNLCAYTHQIYACEPCGRIFATYIGLQDHLNTQLHAKQAARVAFPQSCPICAVNVAQGNEAWSIHKTTKKHVKACKKAKTSPAEVAPQPGVSQGNETHCDICKVLVDTRDWSKHIQKKRHVQRQAFVKYQAALETESLDKGGVIVEGNFDFGFVEPSVSQDAELSTLIKTDQPSARIILLEAKLKSSHGTRPPTPAFQVVVVGSDRHITAAQPLTITTKLIQRFIGRYQDRIEFMFNDTQLNKTFMISRPLNVVIGSKGDHELLKPSSPYVPPVKKKSSAPVRNIVEGIRPPSLNAIPYVGRLPKAGIPPQLLSMLSCQEPLSVATDAARALMPPELDGNSYSRYFKNLLWFEEFKSEQELERYDITNAPLRKHNIYYYLQVPGLAEKRPSVLVGDRIFVQPQGATDGRWFEGHVHFVHQLEVGLRFHGSFVSCAEGSRFHIRFKLNRIPMRRQHQAMEALFVEERIFFPLPTHLRNNLALPITPSDTFNPLISTNDAQRRAVTSITTQPPGSLPFIVFGPPGTGKTTTIVEAIRQILATNSEARVLACAPSNAAADLIAIRLSEALDPTQLFRFYAPSRFKSQVPDELAAYVYTQSEGHFSVPPMERMKDFRVVVSTCVSASFASGIGMPRGHFSHIFVDEVGQATEPEAFVSIKLMADSKTNVILSGDPKQLGPVIRSKIASDLGLQTSYLERLMDREVYDLEQGFSSIVKLVKNFRSHNAILSFPNERFYNGDLQPCADAGKVNSFIGSSYLPSKNFPIIFHAVSGKDDREASSPSFFNIDEISQVRAYVEQLKHDGRVHTADEDIGIIAPYHAQCLKLRIALRSVAEGIKVGSVEEFQGQERPVIIISTVRSSRDFVEYDLRHTLGFVANPRRFNVAVTRAQALLIIVGDPLVLSLDPLWRSFLNYIYLNNGWIGPDITWNPEEPVNEAGGYDQAARERAVLDMDDVVRRVQALSMAEDLDANVDQPRRDDNE